MTNRHSSQPVAERILWIGAAGSLALFLALGWLVSSHSAGGIDLAAGILVGRGGDLIAWTLTQSGFFQSFAFILVVMLLIGLIARDKMYIRRVLFSIVTLVLTWFISDAFKALFDRARPTGWLVRQETSYAYPSGHATLAVMFWVLWAVFLWNSDAPLWVRRAGSIALALMALAVGWSRLELGVHYFSDVVGGYLLGLACLGSALGLAKRLRIALF